MPGVVERIGPAPFSIHKARSTELKEEDEDDYKDIPGEGPGWQLSAWVWGWEMSR